MPQPTVFGRGRLSHICCLLVQWLWMPGCQPVTNPPGWTGPLPSSTGLPNSVGGPAAGGNMDGGHVTTSNQPCISVPVGLTIHDAGNFDFMSCNVATCHFDVPYRGGWVYSSASGPPWLGGATVTIINSDGSIVTSVSGKDGFFFLQDPIAPSYIACVSQCPDANCSVTSHTNSDCQSVGCHGDPNQKIYVAQDPWGTTDAGGSGTSASSGRACESPVSGGAYVHGSFVYGSQACSNCHSTPAFVGGFLFDGPTSKTIVPQASITLVSGSGTPIAAASGPDGMLFFGTVSDSPTTQTLTSPYTACVSKCPQTICSITNGHSTTDDCGTCHNGSTTGKLYLN